MSDNIYVKVLEVTENEFTVQKPNGEIEVIPNIKDILKDKGYCMINCIYMRGFFIKYRADRNLIKSYRYLEDAQSNRSYKTFVKSNLIGTSTKNKEVYGGVYDTLVITDYNNLIKGHVIANKVYFVGDKKLEIPDSGESVVDCKEAIIDNVCVYGELVNDTNSRVQINISDTHITHRFVGLDTVDEIYVISKEKHGLDTVTGDKYEKYRVWMPKFYRSVTVDFKGYNEDALYNRTVGLLEKKRKKINSGMVNTPDKCAELCAMLHLVINMYNSTHKYEKFKIMAEHIYNELSRLEKLNLDSDLSRCVVELTKMYLHNCK